MFRNFGAGMNDAGIMVRKKKEISYPKNNMVRMILGC
jgi:hypothetical protein